MTHQPAVMASLQLQDVTHQLVQQFIAELQEMLDDLMAGEPSNQQKKLLEKIVHFFDKEMSEHHLEEERHIFPLLLSKGDPQLNEAVRLLKADHEELRVGWQALKGCLELLSCSVAVEPSTLRVCFDNYSQCFARHLTREESIQFAPAYQSIFQRWDA